MKFKNLFILLVALVMSTATFAQNSSLRITPGMLKNMKEELKITENQEDEINKIVTSFREKRQELRKAEVESPDQRRTLMTAMMQEQKAALEAILTDDQKSILRERDDKMKQERMAEMEARRNKWKGVDRKAMKAEIQTYKDEKINIVLAQQRAKLEGKISPEDRATIAELRTMKKRGNRGQVKKSEKKMESAPQERTSEITPQPKYKPNPRKKSADKVRVLVTKYEADIDALFEEIKPQAIRWVEDIDAIERKYTGEIKEEKAAVSEEEVNAKGKRKRGKKGKKAKDGLNQIIQKGKFLLLDPATKGEKTDVAKPEISDN